MDFSLPKKTQNPKTIIIIITIAIIVIVIIIVVITKLHYIIVIVIIIVIITKLHYIIVIVIVTTYLHHSYIERFHSRDQRPYWFNETNESICVKKEFNSQRVRLVHQYGRRSFVLVHQHGRHDVMCKGSI